MKHFYLSILAIATLLAGGCNGSRSYSVADFDLETHIPRHAEGFDIRGTEKNNSTLLTIRNPWQGAQGVEQHLLLLRDDAIPPEGFAGQVVKAPVRHVVCMSSSHVAMFDALSQVRRIVGVSGIDYISNTHIQEHSRCGEVRDVGYDTNINFELLTAMRPDLVLLYGVTGENPLITGKLRELAIPYIYVGDYMENSPLGKAEWMVAIAELCDMREQGSVLFGQIESRYNTLKASTKSTIARPRVMLNTPYRDTWFMPSTQSHMVRLIEDAGGEYVYTKNHASTSVAVDLEEAYLLANGADVWINVGACNTLGELTSQNPKFAAIPAIRHNKVWNNNRRQTPKGGSDFWESGVMRPDQVLADLQAILRGTEADTTHYYKRLK